MTAPKAPSARKATCSDDMHYIQLCAGKTLKNTFRYYQDLSCTTFIMFHLSLFLTFFNIFHLHMQLDIVPRSHPSQGCH